MFIAEHHFDHFQIHTIKDSSGNLLEVVPERGAIISRFSIADRDVFYLDRDSLNDASKNVRGGNPVLFPICGPLAGGTCQISGNTYSMKQHGFARNLPWTVLEETLAEDSGKITLELVSNDTTRSQYPFDFSAKLTYELTQKGLKIHQKYENHSKETMPFYAGFHPYFAAPEKTAVELLVSADEYDDFLTGKTLAVESVINFDQAAEVNGAFHNVKEPKVSFNNFGQGRKIEITFDPPYKHIVIWALRDKPFICVEPWMGLNNSLNTGESVYHLEPGTSLETSVAFNIM
jgi:galactose mutarotase-like enzyme